MPAHHINLHPQIQDWTAATSTGATGSMTAVLCEKGVPVWSLDNEHVVSPNPITQTIKNGQLETDHHFDLPVTTGAQYWKFTIELGGLSRTWYFTWDDAAHTDFADLNFIDPYSYEGA